jgi:hypothetical protein
VRAGSGLAAALVGRPFSQLLLSGLIADFMLVLLHTHLIVHH